MKLPRFLRNLLGALAFSLPNFTRGKDEAAEKPTDIRQEQEQTKLVRAGSLERVNKQYGRTIAGGPGSQRIGDTFNALPKAVREEMIAARRGIVRAGNEFEDRDSEHQPEGPWRLGRGSTDALQRALDQRYTRDASGKLIPREDADERLDHAQRLRTSGLDKAVEKARGGKAPIEKKGFA